MWRDVPPAWTSADGAECDVVVSTRARLARNISGTPFPGKAASEDIEKAANTALKAYERLRVGRPELEAVDVAHIDEDDRTFLVDAHLVSPQQINPRFGGFVFLEPGGRIAIMVNEEDHFRIQAILSGLQPIQAWRLVDEIDDELSACVKFSFSSRWGYLTASLTNLGTGLRVSAMMHLAGLAMMGRLAGTLRAAIDLGVSVRGLFGEGTKGLGDLYQVSNEITLGESEKGLAQRVNAVALHLLSEERHSREEILATRRSALIREGRRGLMTFREAETVTAGEALAILSPIRLCSSLGLAGGISIRELNELLIAMRLMRIGEAERYAPIGMDRRRAVLLRRRLKRVDL